MAGRTKPRRKPKRDASLTELVAKEGARALVEVAGASITEAARAVGRPRTTVSDWLQRAIEDGDDEWAGVRAEKRLRAIELAWDGILAQLCAAKDVPHQVFCTKDGVVVDGGVNPHAAAQVAKVQVEVLERLAGIGLVPDGSDAGGQGAKPGESVYRVIIERREGAAP